MKSKTIKKLVIKKELEKKVCRRYLCATAGKGIQHSICQTTKQNS